jgi:hypothetical protein
MSREEDQQVEIRRLAKNIRALEQRASVFDVWSTHTVSPQRFYRSSLRSVSIFATCALF